MSANLREVTHNPEKAPTRAFSLLKWPINYQHFHNWDSIDVKIEELYSRDTDRIHSIGIISQPKTGHCTGKWWGSKCYKDTNIGHLTLTLIDINIESASHFSGRKGIFQKVQLIHNNVQWPSLVFQYVKNIFCCLKSKKVTFFTILNLLLQPKICSTQEQVVCLLEQRKITFMQWHRTSCSYSVPEERSSDKLAIAAMTQIKWVHLDDQPWSS